MFTDLLIHKFDTNDYIVYHRQHGELSEHFFDLDEAFQYYLKCLEHMEIKDSNNNIIKFQ